MYIKFTERRISQHLASLTSSETAFEVEKAQDKTLEDVEGSVPDWNIAYETCHFWTPFTNSLIFIFFSLFYK